MLVQSSDTFECVLAFAGLNNMGGLDQLASTLCCGQQFLIGPS